MYIRMKKRYLMMVALLGALPIAKAQDTFINDRITATDDLNGTARYVGMGGALGALGADLSVISSNPAGIGLYRKCDVALTFGVVAPQKSNGWNINDTRTYGEKLARASFDQMGLVWSLKTDGKLNFVNFAFNYQKKANYNQGFYADNMNLGGLSQLDQIAEMVTDNFVSDYNLAGLVKTPDLNDATLDNYYLTKDANNVYRNTYSSVENAFNRHQSGYMGAFDFNVAFNVSDRFYTGATLGFDHAHYNAWSEYGEWASDGGLNHSLYNETEIRGYGVNAKLGFIVRPIEENPFRIGLTVETPTWYRLDNETFYHLDKGQNVTNYIEYTVRTPWKARVSLGATVDKVLAWGVEYEYANMAKTSMGYPKWADDGYHRSFASDKDLFMNEHTRNTLRGQHTIKAGVEVKPIDKLAVRFGYNFISKRYKDNVSFDQYKLADGNGSGNFYSDAMDYATSTDYMSLGAANIATFGLGFNHKRFYADLTYKYHVQKADFYAFDTNFTTSGSQFANDNPALADMTIQPVSVPLNRHQILLSLGFKF